MALENQQMRHTCFKRFSCHSCLSLGPALDCIMQGTMSIRLMPESYHGLHAHGDELQRQHPGQRRSCLGQRRLTVRSGIFLTVSLVPLSHDSAILSCETPGNFLQRLRLRSSLQVEQVQGVYSCALGHCCIHHCCICRCRKPFAGPLGS